MNHNTCKICGHRLSNTNLTGQCRHHILDTDQKPEAPITAGRCVDGVHRTEEPTKEDYYA